MADQLRTAAEAAVELNAALTRVAEALARTDADALLGAEEGLGRALAGISGVAEAGDRVAAGATLRQARAVLLRCRRLGASFTTVSRAVLRIGDTAPGGYNRAGSYVDRDVDYRGVMSVRARI